MIQQRLDSSVLRTCYCHAQRNEMTLSELRTQIEAAGLIPVFVVNAPPDEENERLVYSGSLAEYLEIAKSIEARTVIVYSEILEQEDFLADLDIDDQDEERANDETTVDLCNVDARLSRFRKHTGQHGIFCVSISIRDEHLDCSLEESWWHDFLEIRDAAIDQLSKQQQDRVDAARSRMRDEARATLAKLHTLLDDKKFTCLPTQKAMLQYALRKFPELSEMSPTVLKTEVQELKAKIDSNVD
jgi:hypothetical protein